MNTKKHISLIKVNNLFMDISTEELSNYLNSGACSQKKRTSLSRELNKMWKDDLINFDADSITIKNLDFIK